MRIKKHIRIKVIYLILLVYIFGILKPISPLINDILEHTFNKTTHLATVHMENGKYHVHKEIAIETKTKKKHTPILSSDELLPNHVNNKSLSIKPFYFNTSVIITETNTKCLDVYFKTLNPPPEV